DDPGAQPAKLGTRFDPQTGKMKPGTKPTPVSPNQRRPIEVIPPTIKGPNHFKIGDSDFTAPAGSKLIKPKTVEGVMYVVTPDGKVHAFNKAGEISVPDYLAPELEKKFKDLKANDPLYRVA